MLGPCCLLPFFLRAELVFELPRVLALWCVHSLEGCIAKAIFSLVCETCIFLGMRYYRGVPQYYH